MVNLVEKRKVLVDTIRNEVAAKGGSSVFSNAGLLTIIDGLEQNYTVVIEFGSWYAIVED